MKKILLLFCIILGSGEIYSQTDTISPVVKLRNLGNFEIGSNKDQKITIDVERIIFKKSQLHDWNETDVSMIIKDRKGVILYKKNYPGSQDGELDYFSRYCYIRWIRNSITCNLCFLAKMWRVWRRCSNIWI